MNSILMLEDGKIFPGQSLHGLTEKIGEVILNTAVVGYQEMITTPANAGKILVLTYPLIGNYGCADKFNESEQVWLSGLVIKEASPISSNWQATSTFQDFAIKRHLPVLTGVDTRSIAIHLRQKGEMPGIIAEAGSLKKSLQEKIKAYKEKIRESQLPKISAAKTAQHLKGKGKQKKIAVIDIGLTNSLLCQIGCLGKELILFAHTASAEEIIRTKPDALIISSGPEADAGFARLKETVKGLIGKFPLLAIGAGHQVLAQALGGQISKMKLGHRGVNYPVYSPKSYKGEITAQNHGYAVSAGSLSKNKDVKITRFNLNDRSVEEMESKKLKFLSVQYELTSPGFQEVHPILKRFL